jgi:hypothetical protein
VPDPIRRMTLTARKLAATAALIGVAAALLGAGTWSAFSGTTSNSGDSFAAGTVTITDDDSGAAMLALSDVRPTATDTSCIAVTYEGSLPASVRLYGTTTGTGFDPYIDVQVTRGTIASPSFDLCTGFTADSTDYIGAGAGVVYNGTLQGFPDSYSSGLVDPTSGSPESWTTNERHVYKIQVTVKSGLSSYNAAENKTATQAFEWEARNN